MNSKWEIYSRILSEKGLRIEYSETAKTAQYAPETKIVTIPTFMFFDEDTTQMLVSHEVGHAKFSDYSKEELLEYSEKYGSLFNVVEDAHIERRMKREFGGLKEIFHNGYKTLAKEDFFGLKETNLSELNLTERLNIYSKLSHVYDVPFGGKENEFACRITMLETKEEVLGLCEDILNYLQEEQERNPLLEGDTLQIPDGESSEGDNTQNGNMEVNENQFQDSENDNGEGVSEELTDSVQAKLKENLEAYGNGKQHEKIANGYDTLEIDRISFKEILDLSTLNLGSLYYNSKYAKNTIGLVKNLARHADTIFQQRRSAHALRSSRHKEIGKLDMKKLAKYRTSMQIFKNQQILAKEKSHGIVMCLDFSGSMSERIGTVILQTAIVAEFCNINKIPFEIVGFGLDITKGNKALYANVVKVCDSDSYSLPALLYWGEMKHGYQRINNYFFRMTSTPTVESLIIASDALRKMKGMGIEKTCLFIVTDGFHNQDCQFDNSESVSISNIRKIVWKGMLNDVSSYIKSAEEHEDWVIELICSAIKRMYDTFISITSLSDLKAMFNGYDKSLRLKLGIDVAYQYPSIDSTEYFYGLKHAHYFKTSEKNIAEKGSLFVVNFSNNPFLDQFQNLDIDSILQGSSSTRNENDLTRCMEYYKMLKIFVSNFISEIA